MNLIQIEMDIQMLILPRHLYLKEEKQLIAQRNFVYMEQGFLILND